MHSPPNPAAVARGSTNLTAATVNLSAKSGSHLQDTVEYIGEQLRVPGCGSKSRITAGEVFKLQIW